MALETRLLSSAEAVPDEIILGDTPSCLNNNSFIPAGEQVVHHSIHYTDKYNFLDIPETWGNGIGLSNEMVYVFQYK